LHGNPAVILLCWIIFSFYSVSRDYDMLKAAWLDLTYVLHVCAKGVKTGKFHNVVLSFIEGVLTNYQYVIPPGWIGIGFYHLIIIFGFVDCFV